MMPPYYLAQQGQPSEPLQLPGPQQPGYAPSEEELAQLVELGVVPDEMLENFRRQRAAEEAASMGPPEGRRAGGSYVAANPLEHIASAGSRVAALMKLKQLRQQHEELVGKKRQGYQTMQGIGQHLYGPTGPMDF